MEEEEDDVPAEQETKQKLDPLPKFIEITNFDPIVTKPRHDLSTLQERDATLAQLEDFISSTTVSRPAAMRVLH